MSRENPGKLPWQCKRQSRDKGKTFSRSLTPVHMNLIATKLAPRLLKKVSKGAKIRNRYNQVPRLTQDTNGKVTNSQLDTANEIQEVSRFPAGDHKAQINRRAQRHNKLKTEKHKTCFMLNSTEQERISSDKASNLPKRDIRFILLK